MRGHKSITRYYGPSFVGGAGRRRWWQRSKRGNVLTVPGAKSIHSSADLPMLPPPDQSVCLQRNFSCHSGRRSLTGSSFSHCNSLPSPSKITIFQAKLDLIPVINWQNCVQKVNFLSQPSTASPRGRAKIMPAMVTKSDDLTVFS